MRFSSTPTDIDAGYRSGDDFMHVDGAPVTDILQLVSSLEGGGGGGELKAQYETWTRTLLLQLLPCLPNHERDAEQGASSVLTVGAGGGGVCCFHPWKAQVWAGWWGFRVSSPPLC